MKTAQRIEAERLCREFPEASNLSLARRLAKEFKSTIEAARDCVRAARGAKGKSSGKDTTLHRPKGKAGQLMKCPPSLAEPWEPYEAQKCSRVGVISDTHIPYHSEVALTAAIEDLKVKKIDTLVINGDFADFYQISRWQKDPRKRRFSEELGSVIEALEWIRQELPKAKIVYKDGNHEERWQHFIWNRAPEIYDLPACRMKDLLQLDRLKIEHVSDQRPVLVGKLVIAHGHELGRGIFSPVNPARGAFLRTHHTILVGHSHQTSGHADTNIWHDETFCWSTGCLCELTPEYARINRWNHGFAFVEVSKDGSFSVHNQRIDKAGNVRAS